MKLLILLALACLSACSWFGWRRPPPPDPTEIIVTGAPRGSIVFIDGAQVGQATEGDDRPVGIRLAAGDHKVEIHLGDKVVYREDLYVGRGERHMVSVLSGSSR